MSDELWRPLTAALDRSAEAGRTLDVWLRDDDAEAPSPALTRLVALCELHRLPVLLAVIPAKATAKLVDMVADHPLITPTQHGFRHANHAAPGERARELGGIRPLAEVLDDIVRGRDRLATLFRDRAARILVPPWNRIDEAAVPTLPSLGFEALSTFGPATWPIDGLATLNADLDIIDWRHGRVCRPHDQLVERLAAVIDAARTWHRPIGLLTHHLVHDEAAWSFLDGCLSHLARHRAIRFAIAADLVRTAGARSPR